MCTYEGRASNSCFRYATTASAFRSAVLEQRFGPLGMREHVYMRGGSLAVDKPSDGGGRITVRLPVAA